jgi:hypothetical protein
MLKKSFSYDLKRYINCRNINSLIELQSKVKNLI